MRNNPNLSRRELAKLIPSVTEDGIRYHLKKLQDKGLLRRVGANFGGHWEVLGKGLNSSHEICNQQYIIPFIREKMAVHEVSA